MSDTIQAQLGALGTELQAAAIPDTCKQAAAWCLGKLPTLYTKLGLTHESRYGDEITSLVQSLLKEFTSSPNASLETRKCAASFSERLSLLHERFGLPGLNLKDAAAPSSRSRKSTSNRKKVMPAGT